MAQSIVIHLDLGCAAQKFWFKGKRFTTCFSLVVLFIVWSLWIRGQKGDKTTSLIQVVGWSDEFSR